MQLQQGFPGFSHQTAPQQPLQTSLSQISIAAPQALQPTPQSQHTTPAQKPPAGIPNPMYKQADFNLPQHPYQNFYVAPNNHFGNAQGGGTYYGFQ